MRSSIVTSVIALLAFVVGAFAWAEPTTRPTLPKPDPKTQAVYDRIKGLAGTWEGKSSKGWTEVLEIDMIAGGSCVIERSHFAHENEPNSDMVTMYHLDGPNLLLTHYCMARNQPRLKATEMSDDGRQVTFTFLDGTNMASRDVGHMDKVRINFEDQDNFNSQWTFYANGKEKWMEAVKYVRVKQKTATK